MRKFCRLTLGPQSQTKVVRNLVCSRYELNTGPWPPPRGQGTTSRSDSYLVDPASSHMLVSKIKPCMSKYKPH